MVNIQDFIENNGSIKTFKVDELLFAEFECPMENAKDSIWWHNNFFFYIVSGATKLISPEKQYYFKSGDCGFAKKGSIITQNQYRENEIFCELMIFVPDSFIKYVIQKNVLTYSANASGQRSDTIIPLEEDEILTSYFNTLVKYFVKSDKIPENLLKLKFEELILNIFVNNDHNLLKSYFLDICRSAKPAIRDIMETNFPHNLALPEFARLCGRSLSAFKMEFKSIYNMTPGKWLREKRLIYSQHLLKSTSKNIEEVTFESGFKNSSHFIRIFKERFGLPPSRYQMKNRLA